MYCRRDFSEYAEALYLKVVVLCTLFFFSTCEPCSMNGLQSPVEYDECGSGIQNALADDFSQLVMSGDSLMQVSLENVCGRSDMFCFLSTLSGFFPQVPNAESSSGEHSAVQEDAPLLIGSIQVTNNINWSSKQGSFKLSSGSIVSCSLDFQEGIHDVSHCQIDGKDQTDVSSCRGPLLDSKNRGFDQSENPGKIKSGILDNSSSVHVEITPPLLDWGKKELYFPSVAFLTLKNTDRHTVLNVYEPYSTNSQFYPCNFSEMMLRPGEAASICFVFFPTWLGSSSAHLVLQTSSGGFLVHTRGFAIESPYGIQPLVGLDYSSSGRWTKNISLSNPFEETLYVKEISAWVSFSSGETSVSTKVVCSVKNPEVSCDSTTGLKESLNIDSGQIDLPVMTMRPHKTWVVDPNSYDTILELDFSYPSQGKIVGSFCFQLLRDSKSKVDTVMVPLDAEVGGRATYEDLKSPVSISLEALMPCDANRNIIVALLLENAAPYLLTVVKISVIGDKLEPFRVKYVEGLILFPGTVTKAAVVTYTPFANPLGVSSSQDLHMNFNCKLLLQTNESSAPQIEIPCSDIITICPRRPSDHVLEHVPPHKESDYGNEGSRSLPIRVQPPTEVKALEIGEADELVLGNWKSHCTAVDMSVLDDHEILFPFVHVGSHHSKWITVRNPSEKPVVMQLVLNSGEIVDECQHSDGILQPSSSNSFVQNDYSSPLRYGFSVGDPSLTEAYVHPHGRASLGPILFHPSSRCAWKSSALVRNNLSGVEWLSLRGSGGSLSLLLFEGSDPVQTVEFNYSAHSALHFSSPNILSSFEDSTHACGQPSLKEIYAKNAGDLRLEVKKIEVSGTECELDGFVVHNCKGFALEPGESTKLIVSHRADFSAATVQRDLELAMSGGILVIPMKATLPASMLMICKKSHLWIKVKKSYMAILVIGFIFFLVLCNILPQLPSVGSHDNFLRSGKNIIATVRHTENSPRVSQNQKNGSKFAMATNINAVASSIGEEDTVMLESVCRYPDGSSVSPEQEKPSKCANQTVHQTCSHDSGKEVEKSSSLLSKFIEVERTASEAGSQPGMLSIKTGKEKGRRRRKKKSSATGLTGQFEVSSSQSGNSTPSSPLSPFLSSTPNRSRALSPDVKQPVETKNPFSHMNDRICEEGCANAPSSGINLLEPKISLKYGSDSLFFPTKEKPSAPRKTISKPVLLPSATFPCTGRSSLMNSSPILASTPTIALHARAPGFKLCEQKAVKAQEKKGNEDEFKYDIWGDHLFGLPFAGVSKNVSSMSPLAKGSNSDSFFVRGPQSLVTNPQAKVVTSNQDG